MLQTLHKSSALWDERRIERENPVTVPHLRKKRQSPHCEIVVERDWFSVIFVEKGLKVNHSMFCIGNRENVWTINESFKSVEISEGNQKSSVINLVGWAKVWKAKSGQAISSKKEVMEPSMWHCSRIELYVVLTYQETITSQPLYVLHRRTSLNWENAWPTNESLKSVGKSWGTHKSDSKAIEKENSIRQRKTKQHHQLHQPALTRSVCSMEYAYFVEPKAL